MIPQDLTQSAANDLDISANAMPKVIPAHPIDDIAFFIDEQGALHIGMCRNNGVMNPHLPENLQSRPAHIDLIAANQQGRRPLHDGRTKPVAPQPIGGSESCGSCPEINTFICSSELTCYTSVTIQATRVPRRGSRDTCNALLICGCKTGSASCNFSRRKFLHLAAGAGALPAVSRIAWGQTYPTRTVTLIVPFAAGGATDVAARVAAEHMSRTLGQQFIIENVPGAGGTTGSIRAMRANPDGHTILMGHMGTHAVSVSLYPNLAYKPEIDFEPIGVVIELPLLIGARKDFPARDLKEFVAYAKANADKLNMAHAGVGSNAFNFGLVLSSILGIKPTLVPFNGTGPATNALVGGQVDYLITAIPELGSHIQAGTVKAYAIGAAQRNPAVPNVPTAEEAGLPEFQASPWFALFAPKGTPQSHLDKLSDALDKALDDPGVRRRFADLGGDIPAKAKRGRQPLATLVKSEIARWAPIIKAANIKLD